MNTAQSQIEQVARTLLVLGLVNFSSLALLIALVWAIYSGVVVPPFDLPFVREAVFFYGAAAFLAVGMISSLAQYLGAAKRVSEARHCAKRLAHAEKRSAKLYPISFFGSYIFLLGGNDKTSSTERVVLAMKAGSPVTSLVSIPARTGTAHPGLNLASVDVAIACNESKEPSLITLDDRLYVVIMEYPQPVVALFRAMESPASKSG